jgi:hypothetical protein
MLIPNICNWNGGEITFKRYRNYTHFMYTEGSFWSLFNKSLLNPVHNPPLYYVRLKKGLGSPVTGPEWPRGLQEVKVPRFHDSGTELW